MFAEAGKWLRITTVAIALVATGTYYTWLAMTTIIGYRECVAAGADRDGQELTFPLWVVSGIDGADRYRISKVIRDVPVEGSTEEIREGTTVSVTGKFRASDAVVVQEVREVHVLRVYKEALGVLGTILALIAAPFGFRMRGWSVVERG